MASLSEKIHGTKVKIPPFVPTDPIAMLKKLLNGEITDWPQIQQLSKLFQQQQFDQMGFDLPSLLSLGGEDAKTLLEQAGQAEKGKIPDDVAQQVMRSSAFQSLGAGSIGGPMGSALAARNLGLTSLDMISKGADWASSAGNATQRWQQISKGTMLPESSYLYSPQWFTDFMGKQAAAKRDAQLQKAIQAAAPDPAWAQRGKLAASILGAYAGGGMGGASAGQSMNYESNVPTFGGANQYAATTGGINLGPYNFGGSDIPYMGGGGMPSDVSTPGYPVYPHAEAVPPAPPYYGPNTAYNYPNQSAFPFFSSFNQGMT